MSQRRPREGCAPLVLNRRCVRVPQGTQLQSRPTCPSFRLGMTPTAWPAGPHTLPHPNLEEDPHSRHTAPFLAAGPTPSEKGSWRNGLALMLLQSDFHPSCCCRPTELPACSLGPVSAHTRPTVRRLATSLPLIPSLLSITGHFLNVPVLAWRMRSAGPRGDCLSVAADSLHFTLQLLPGPGGRVLSPVLQGCYWETERAGREFTT